MPPMLRVTSMPVDDHQTSRSRGHSPDATMRVECTDSMRLTTMCAGISIEKNTGMRPALAAL